MITTLFLLTAQMVTVPSGKGISIDEKVAILAEREAGNRNRLEYVIYDDPAMRAEVRRVRVKAGCAAIADASKETIARHAPLLRPYAVEAIRSVIPEARLAEARAVSFIAYPLTIYSGRVRAKLDELAAGPIATARAEMRKSFLARTARLPASIEVAEQAVRPKQDLSAALGLNGSWDFNKPTHMALACAEQGIHPGVRPKIRTGDQTR